MNEKGFTLVEILVVIAIIAIFFVTLLPQIDQAVIRSRESGIRTDFRVIEQGSTSFLRETGGSFRTIKTLDTINSFFDTSMQLTNFTGGDIDGDGFFEAALAGEFSKKDPYGQPYKLIQAAHADVPNVKGMKIVIKSFGKNEKEDTYIPDNKDYDDYILSIYSLNGIIATCTYGFSTNNLELTGLQFVSDTNGDGMIGCGDDVKK